LVSTQRPHHLKSTNDLIRLASQRTHLILSRVGAILGNVALLTTVVTRLVTSWFGAVSRNVANLSAVKAATKLSPGLVDLLPRFTFKTRIRTITSNVTRLRESDIEVRLCYKVESDTIS
jgi:hypothetical protein